MSTENKHTEAKIVPDPSVGSGDLLGGPWAWTREREAEYWNPGGSSRKDAIAAAMKQGRSRFWIAGCRRMTTEEKELFDGEWIVDPSKEELVKPNIQDQPTPGGAAAKRKESSNEN